MTSSFDAQGVGSLFREIDRELAQVSGVQQVLDRLCRIAVERVAGAEWAGVSQGKAGLFETVAATTQLVRDVDAVQYDLLSGPCVAAMSEEHVFSVADLAVDDRWPEFGRAAAALGVRSMMSHRLFLEDQSDTIAALNFYSSTTDAFHDVDETLAVLLATHGAMVLARAVESTRADNLTVALQNSRDIGIAIGILMSTYRITRDEGFDILRLFSQRANRKLAHVAADVADTGALPEPPDRPRSGRRPARPRRTGEGD